MDCTSHRPGSRGACSTPLSASRPTDFPSCSPACQETTAAFPSSTSAPTSRKRGRRAQSSASSPFCAGSKPVPTPAGPGCTSTRRCRTGCPTSRSATCGPGAGSMTLHFRDGQVDVGSNSSGYDVVRGALLAGCPRLRVPGKAMSPPEICALDDDFARSPIGGPRRVGLRPGRPFIHRIGGFMAADLRGVRIAGATSRSSY